MSCTTGSGSTESRQTTVRRPPVLKRMVVLASGSLVASPEEFAAAQRVGRRLGDNGITLVYDGHAHGPAGVLARVALAAGGRVVGIVLPEHPADAEEQGLTERRSAVDIQAQRAAYRELADAWLALPGALDSLDALTTLRPADTARETPIGLLDEGGYYSELLATASDQALDRFVQESQRGSITLCRDLDELLLRLRDYRPPETRRTTSGVCE